MEKNGHIPKFLGSMNEKYNIPRVAIVFNAIVSMIMVSLFRDWAVLASVISTATLVAYLTGPTTVISLRKMAPNMHRPFRAKMLGFMAPFSFVVASLAIYWAMWPTTAQVIFIIILGLPIYFFYEYKTNWTNTKKQIGGSIWIIAYLIILAFLSFIGSKEFNGLNWIHYPYDFIVIAVVALVFYKLVTTSYFEGIYFKRAKKINKKMKENLPDESQE